MIFRGAKAWSLPHTNEPEVLSNMVDFELSKPYRLTFSYHKDFLEARIVGLEDSFEISTAYWQEIAAEVRSGGFKKVLVIEKLAGDVDITSAYDIASLNARTDFRNAKIAFVDEYKDHSESNRFSETVSNNRGRNIRVHNTIAEARDWLLK